MAAALQMNRRVLFLLRFVALLILFEVPLLLEPVDRDVVTPMSALAIGELVRQVLADLGGTVEVGEMAVREEARGLLLPTAIFARWSRF